VTFDPQQIQDILVIIVAAATPLLLAAIGEVVAERAGVLNLGLEGMMIVGASTGFAFAYLSGSTLVGVAAGWSRWLELRLDRGAAHKIASVVWPVSFVFAGLLLLFYREA